MLKPPNVSALLAALAMLATAAMWVQARSSAVEQAQAGLSELAQEVRALRGEVQSVRATVERIESEQRILHRQDLGR